MPLYTKYTPFYKIRQLKRFNKWDEKEASVVKSIDTVKYLGMGLLLTAFKDQLDWTDTEALHYRLQLIADDNNAILLHRASAYCLSKGRALRDNNYKASTDIEEWEQLGLISEVIDSDRFKQAARTASVKKVKRFSKKILKFINYILSTELTVLIKQFNENVKYHPTHTLQNQDAQGFHNLVMDYLVNLKAAQHEQRTSTRFLQEFINKLIPFGQAHRKDYILASLIRHRRDVQTISGQSSNGTAFCSQEPLPVSSSIDISVDISEESRELTPSTPLFVDLIESSEVERPSEFDKSKCKDYRLDCQGMMSRLLSRLDVSLDGELRKRAYRMSLKDDIDVRQSQMMYEEGALPKSYVSKSVNSPRVYAKEVDNLFYCRKERRKEVLRGLGLVDIDLSSCHTHIMLGQWGDSLPVLRELIEKGNLWVGYEKYFKSMGVSFKKKVVKPMHYASFLAGGDNAFLEAIHKYNNDTNEPIGEEESAEIRKTFKESPVYSELHKLHLALEHDMDSTVQEVITGEKYAVRRRRYWKDKEGKSQCDKGTFLTYLSAYLQSIEISIMSYAMLKCEEALDIVLWQHDGITARVKTDNSIKQFQDAVNEASQSILGRDIPLTLEYLD